MTERGRVEHGRIVFPRPLSLPDGTEVVVHIEPLVAEGQPEARGDDEDFGSLPFFGMWADRPDMDDSAAWVRSEREQWQRRTTPDD
jgi:hypothetical protein